MLTEGLVETLRRASEPPIGRSVRMNAFKCDRCKRFQLGGPDMIVPALTAYFADSLHEAKELCEMCTSALRRFFNNDRVEPLQ